MENYEKDDQISNELFGSYSFHYFLEHDPLSYKVKYRDIIFEKNLVRSLYNTAGEFVIHNPHLNFSEYHQDFSNLIKRYESYWDNFMYIRNEFERVLLNMGHTELYDSGEYLASGVSEKSLCFVKGNEVLIYYLELKESLFYLLYRLYETYRLATKYN